MGKFNRLLCRQQTIQCKLMGCRVRMCKIFDCIYRATCEINLSQEKMGLPQPEIDAQSADQCAR